MDTLELEQPAPGLLQTVFSIPKAVDKFVVGTGRGIVAIVSPDLADSMVNLDRSFKNTYVNILKGTANFTLGIFGFRWK